MKIAHEGGFLFDMDGVVCSGGILIPGARELFARLEQLHRPYLLLTNNSQPTPAEIQSNLRRMGLELPLSAIYTAALATVAWAKAQNMGERVMALGEAGLEEALVAAGYTLTRSEPDWVVVGEIRHLDYEDICLAVAAVKRGARLVATNPDVLIPNGDNLLVGCGAVVAMLEKAAGVQAHVVGKPNVSMFQSAMQKLSLRADQLIMIGDSMETDIAGACAAGLRSILVLSGITRADDITRFPHRPTYVVNSVAEIEVV